MTESDITEILTETMMEPQESLGQQLLTSHSQADNKPLNALTQEKSQDEIVVDTNPLALTESSDVISETDLEVNEDLVDYKRTNTILNVSENKILADTVTGQGAPFVPLNGSVSLNSSAMPSGMVWTFNSQIGQYCWMQVPTGPPGPSSNPSQTCSRPSQQPYYNPFQMQQMQAHQAMMHGQVTAPSGYTATGGTFVSPSGAPGAYGMYPMMAGMYGNSSMPGTQGAMPSNMLRMGNNILMPLRPQAIVQRPPVVIVPSSSQIKGLHSEGSRGGPTVSHTGMLSMLQRQQKGTSARASIRSSQKCKRREEDGVTDEEEDASLSNSSEDEDLELHLGASDEEDSIVKIKGMSSTSSSLSHSAQGLARSRPKRESTRKVDYSTFDKEHEDTILEDTNSSTMTILKSPRPKHLQKAEGSTMKKPRIKKEETSAVDGFIEYDSDDDFEGGDAAILAAEDDLPFVEKIISAKEMTRFEALELNKKYIPKDDFSPLDGYRLRESSGTDMSELNAEEMPMELLFLVKQTQKSYLHLEWVTKRLILAERGGSIRLNRFLKKFQAQQKRAQEESSRLHQLSLLGHTQNEVKEELFDPQYTVIDRILYHCFGSTDNSNLPNASLVNSTLSLIEKRSFYVKWAGLGLDQCTWEVEEDLLELEATEGEMGSDRLQSYLANLEPSPDKKAAAADFAQHKSHFQSAAGQEKALTPAMLSLMVSSTAPRPSYIELTKSPLYKNDNELRSYQLEGLNWLMFCWTNRQSCIIADEMGLGKTVQSVSFINRLTTQYHIPGPFLVVAPLSTLPHWKREFESWTDLRVLVYHGKLIEREIMFDYEFFYRDPHEGHPLADMYKFDVLLTTYEMALGGVGHLGDIPWKVAFFDEAHRLKNKNSKAAEVLATFYLEHKVLLTGTPLQNSLEELWALLNFLQPTRFYDLTGFMKEFGDMKRAEDVQRLQAILKPIMLRRLKEDVEKSIPVKEETIIEVELTLVQKRYYRAILERNFGYLLKGGKTANMPNLLNIMMELRKCCIHPYLIKGAEEQILLEELSKKSEFSAMEMEQQVDLLIKSSGKLVLLDKLLKKLKEGGHKVLIFSQMTRCLDLLSDLLVYRGYAFERIDGSIRGDLRQAAIDRFCGRVPGLTSISGSVSASTGMTGADPFIFLLCTRAGGVGINLTAADTVIIFDSDWNPQNDLQAQARCHRIGQDKHVKVYRLITRGTYERDMFDRAGKKLGLDKAILQRMDYKSSQAGETTGSVRAETDQNSVASTTSTNPTTSTLPGGLSKREVETLLRKGAYGVVMENDEDAIRFCEEDIDQILERRTRIIQHGKVSETFETGNAPAETSLFSKASFTVATEGDTAVVDIHDPLFWERWGKANRIQEKSVADEEVGSVRNTPMRSSRLKLFQQKSDDGSTMKKRRRSSKRGSESGDDSGLDDEEGLSASGDLNLNSSADEDEDEEDILETEDEEIMLDDDGRPIRRYGHLYSGRGRPKGSRGGGRPKGSKNRPKEERIAEKLRKMQDKPSAMMSSTRGRGGKGAAGRKCTSKWTDSFPHHNGRGAITLAFKITPLHNLNDFDIEEQKNILDVSNTLNASKEIVPISEEESRALNYQCSKEDSQVKNASI